MPARFPFDDGEGACSPHLVPLNILVVCDDFTTGRKAHAALINLQHALGDQKFNLRFWSFTQIQSDSLGQVAAEEAALSDLIFFATADDQDLPPPVKRWIAKWEDHLDTCSFGLGVMVNGDATENEVANSGFRYLSGLARRHDADFFQTRIPVWEDEMEENEESTRSGAYVHCFRGPEPEAGRSAGYFNPTESRHDDDRSDPGFRFGR